MSRIDDAEKKLEYADFLLRSPGGEFVTGAKKHIFNAASLIVLDLTQIEEKMAGSPRFVQQTLSKFEEPEAREFASFYLRMAGGEVDAKIALEKTRKFLEWVRQERNL